MQHRTAQGHAFICLNSVAILNNGVGFIDNPGLCYAPYSINWDDILEYPSTQPVVLVPPSSHNWIPYCHGRYEAKEETTTTTQTPETTKTTTTTTEMVSTTTAEPATVNSTEPGMLLF